jgi:hypothetical protein
MPARASLPGMGPPRRQLGSSEVAPASRLPGFPLGRFFAVLCSPCVFGCQAAISGLSGARFPDGSFFTGVIRECRPFRRRPRLPVKGAPVRPVLTSPFPGPGHAPALSGHVGSHSRSSRPRSSAGKSFRARADGPVNSRPLLAWRIAARSAGVVPPHTPSTSLAFSAHARHRARAGHPPHSSFARPADAAGSRPPCATGNHRLGSSPLHSAPGSDGSISPAGRTGSTSVPPVPGRLTLPPPSPRGRAAGSVVIAEVSLCC